MCALPSYVDGQDNHQFFWPTDRFNGHKNRPGCQKNSNCTLRGSMPAGNAAGRRGASYLVAPRPLPPSPGPQRPGGALRRPYVPCCRVIDCVTHGCGYSLQLVVLGSGAAGRVLHLRGGAVISGLKILGLVMSRRFALSSSIICLYGCGCSAGLVGAVVRIDRVGSA